MSAAEKGAGLPPVFVPELWQQQMLGMMKKRLIEGAIDSSMAYPPEPEERRTEHVELDLEAGPVASSNPPPAREIDL